MGILDIFFNKKESNPDKLALEGEVNVRLGNYKKALKLLNAAIAIEPNNDMYYASRSKAYKGLKKIKEAQEDIEKAISINPEVTLYKTLKEKK